MNVCVAIVCVEVEVLRARRAKQRSLWRQRRHGFHRRRVKSSHRPSCYVDGVQRLVVCVPPYSETQRPRIERDKLGIFQVVSIPIILIWWIAEDKRMIRTAAPPSLVGFPRAADVNLQFEGATCCPKGWI